FGMSPQEARQKRSLGFVFQDAALLPWRTALQNVELPVEVGGFRGLRSDDPTPRELLKLVGLDGWEQSFPHELSGGMRQRVSIDLPRDRDLSIRETEPFVRIAAKLRGLLGRGAP